MLQRPKNLFPRILWSFFFLFPGERLLIRRGNGAHHTLRKYRMGVQAVRYRIKVKLTGFSAK